MTFLQITSPDDPALVELCGRLAELAAELDRTGHWPAEQLRLCGEYGVYRWFLDPRWGGLAWDEEAVVRGYLELAAACLTTTFIITQRSGACRRIEGCENERLKELLLSDLASGAGFATVGISHLTTSRRHLKTPVLQARRVEGGFRLERPATARRRARRPAGCFFPAAGGACRRVGQPHRPVQFG
jgi:alkylation response protein AidB-like acyl-CoA dehydrogenase